MNVRRAALSRPGLATLALFVAACGGTDAGSEPESLNGYIVFLRSGSEPPTQVWAVRQDGTDLRQLTTSAAHSVQDAHLAPDGRRVAVLRHALAGGANELVIVRVEDGSVTPVPLPLNAYTVRWSPDGSRFLLTCYDPAPSPPRLPGDAVCRVNANGTGFTRLTHVPAGTRAPSWSPEGMRIAYVSEQDGGPEIYRANQDGSQPSRLTSDEVEDNAPSGPPTGPAWPSAGPAARADVSDFAPAWSPDGGTIAFVTDRFAGPGDPPHTIALMDANGSNVRRLLPASGFADNVPSWGPVEE